MPGPTPKFKMPSRVLSVRVPAIHYEAIKKLVDALVRTYLP